MELVDVVDSKSTAGDSVPVRVRSPAPEKSKSQDLLFSFNMHSLSRKGDLMEIVYQDNRIVVALKTAGVLSTDEPAGK